MWSLKSSAEELYNKELKNIHSILGKGLTYGSELTNLGKKMFGNKFKGVYAADELTNLKKEDSGYFIFNLDKKNEPGSHWIGVVKNRRKLPDGTFADKILVYDSFGRDTKEIAPGIYSIGNIYQTENDAEQKIEEEDCGSRVITWFKIYDDYGPEIASLI